MRASGLLLLLCGWLAIGSNFGAESALLKSSAKIVALVFVSSECPISNKLSPEIERLYQKYSTNGVSFTVVYPNAGDTEEKIAAHRKDFRQTAPYVRDASHELVKAAGATITPEAAVFNEKRELIYRGRITDQFLSIGRGRPAPTVHDLEEAIAAALAGQKPKQARVEAVGCYIQD